MSLGGLFQGVMYAQGKRFSPGLNLVVYYLGICLGLVMSGPIGACWGAVFGAALGGLVVPLRASKGVAIKLNLPVRSADLQGLLRALALSPAYSLATVGLVLLHFCASYLTPGSNSIVELSYCLILPAVAIF